MINPNVADFGKKLSTMPPKKNKPPKPWSLHPSRHRDVLQLLEDSRLTFDFHDVDDPFTCTEEHDTNIMGRFRCWNTRCASTGWSSNMIPVTVRLYSGSRYNVRVYNQRCQGCGRMSRAKLDDSYAERVAYRLKKWSGIEVEPPFFSGKHNGPHLIAFCEGCRDGRCHSTT